VPDFALERLHLARGRRVVAGVDEAGRGALCGPVVAAAVVLPAAFYRGRTPAWLRKTDDSKRLSPSRRAELARAIGADARALAVGLATHLEVDRLNVFRAAHLAMRRAVELLPDPPEIVLVDGPALRDFPYRQQAVLKGDQRSYSIASASIVAKVVRDGIMTCGAEMFRGYGLDRNKGYGTAKHYEALDLLGPSPFHRRSFRLQYPRKLI